MEVPKVLKGSLGPPDFSKLRLGCHVYPLPKRLLSLDSVSLLLLSFVGLCYQLMIQNKYPVFFLENLSFSLLQSPVHFHNPESTTALWRLGSAPSIKLQIREDGDGRGERALGIEGHPAGHARNKWHSQLTRAHNTEATSASCFYAGFRKHHPWSQLRVVWVVVLNSSLPTGGIKVSIFFEEL